MMKRLPLLCLLLSASALPAAPGGENGGKPGPSRVIVCPEDAPGNMRLAAREIRRYAYLRTGELLPVNASSRHPGRIVLAVDASLGKQSYRLRTRGKSLEITGGSPLGVLYGAYAFAEKLGVRFQLDGDVILDRKTGLDLPALDETRRPLFSIRGVLPYNNFAEGPDLWSLDDYKAYLSQVAKLRMNFIGLHTYTKSTVGSEPTVWLGLPGDVGENGDPLFSYKSSYFNTTRSHPGYLPRPTSGFLFGGSLLFESDIWGPPAMKGLLPHGKTAEEKKRLFVRSGRLLREAFEYARTLGIKTCAGTEIPLTHPTRILPDELRARLKEKGLSVHDPETHKALYKGTFLRAMRSYPLDYYWLWTPESWRRPRPDSVVEAARKDLLLAVEAARDARAPFTLATAGWVLGPARDRTMFDKLLPEDMPFSALNRELGTHPVDEGFKSLGKRPGWAIPWLEDDLSMSSPQLWVGRVLRDAYDARRYGCEGLIGIHWRTAEIGPMAGAMARAHWQVPHADATGKKAERPIAVLGGQIASFGEPVENTRLDPVYQTVRWDVQGYELSVPDGRYRVTLQFSEPTCDAAGKRVFGVTLQDRVAIDRLDIHKRAGGKNRALDLSFGGIEVTGGKLRIGFLKDIASQLIGADRKEAEGKYAGHPCIAGIVARGAGKTVRINCGGPAWGKYAADPGPVRVPRYLPSGAFYLDWARSQFGAGAAEGIAGIFARIDGRLPAPAPHCPGGLVVNRRPWERERARYAFVDELAALRPRVAGKGNRARFDHWLRAFRYLRAIGRVTCTLGEMGRAMGELKGLGDPRARRAFARGTVLPVRARLARDWGRMVTLCLETANTWGSIGHVLTHEGFNRGRKGLLERHDAAIRQALGADLPGEVLGTREYLGQPRLIVPTRRDQALEGESLALKVIVLCNGRPESAALFWRPMGMGEYRRIPLAHVARAVHKVTLPPLQEDIEYYIQAGTSGGKTLVWPATAPELNHTVVVRPQASRK